MAGKQILEKMGIFAGFLLVTVFSVFLYSPTNGSNATSSSPKVTIDIGTVLSVTLSSNKVEMSGLPGQTVISDPIRVYAFTNSASGMVVDLNDADDDSYMRNTETGDYIKPFMEWVMKLFRGELSEEEMDQISDFYQLDGIAMTRIDQLGDNEWASIDGMSTAAYDDGVDHILPIWPVDSEHNSGQTLIDSHKANSQYEPGEHISLELDDNIMLGGFTINDYVRIDENHNAYEDIRFVAKIGNNLTSGKYTDTVIITAYINN